MVRYLDGENAEFPEKILKGADCVRCVRNEFVHDLSVDAFDKLKAGTMDSVGAHLSNFSPGPIEDDAKAFKSLVVWTAIGLRVYAVHVSRLNDFIRGTRFRDGFEAFVKSQAGGLG